MAERIWDKFLTEQDREMVARKPRPRFGFGERAAVISVDNYRWAVGDEPLPIEESTKLWPHSTGLAAWEALEHIKTLFAEARAVDIPVIHVTGLEYEESGVMPWTRWRGTTASTDPADPEMQERHARRFEIVEQAAPLPGETFLRKTSPSAFFGTPLMAQLNAFGVDTIIVCGESTSGCVRATVVEGRSYRFRVIVAEECVYDRNQAAHAINLFDMNDKYADVLALDEVTQWMRGQGKAEQLRASA